MSKKTTRPRLTPEELKVIEDYRKGKPAPHPHQLSAWREDGTIMSLDEYCEHHRLPREDVTSYKLITHSTNPYYNTHFKEQIEGIKEIDFKEVVNEALNKLGKPLKLKPIDTIEGDVTRVIYTDTHIAMCTDEEGSAMYATKWDAKAVLDSCDRIIRETIKLIDKAQYFILMT